MSLNGKSLQSLSVRIIGLLCVAVVLLSLSSLRGLAQQVSRPLLGNGNVFLPSSRLDKRGIKRARVLISNGEFSEAIRFLDGILARSEDSFVADSEGKPFGLKETVRQILNDLPEEGRRIYETTYGPVARRLLKQSIESGNFAQLRQITQRYFYTPAGLEAALLYAQHESDEGRLLTAALTYQQLLETAEATARFQPQLSLLSASSWLAAGRPALAANVLEDLGEQGDRRVQVSGQNFSLQSSRNDKIAWLQQAIGTPVIQDLNTERQWLTSRGNPARNGQAEGGLPHLRVRWQVRLLEHRNLEAILEEMAGLNQQQKKPQMPAATPLAVGDYVITRSAYGLVAIDFRTGKRVWKTQPQSVSLLKDLMNGSNHENENENNRNGNVESAQIFARMVWEDFLYNSTSSDGQRVYAIRDLSPPRLSRRRSARFFVQGINSINQENGTNRLCAYDLPTQGKLVWEIDGAARTDGLQGAFFLGAPVTVGQSLYCLAELKNETAIYLVVLDRQTGDLRWRQQLANLENGVSNDIKRRLQASMPSYDEGMLVCPTGAGIAIGVDLAKQSLAWSYQYASKQQLAPRQVIMKSQALAVKKEWVHSAPVITEGRVLLTPPESSFLHCIDLRTGELLWKQPRGDAFFLAGVEAGHVLLVGNRKMSALNLADGTPAWRSGSLDLPAGSEPAGTGFFSKGQYFLPLSNASVIAVDISNGSVVGEANSRENQQLGNLICYRGAVISQTGRHVDCFEQMDVLRKESERRLRDEPTDDKALRMLGEIAYNDGLLTRAIELLSKAYESEPGDLRTREVLSEALVAALDQEYAEHQHLLPLLAKIQQGSSEEQLTLMRLQSQGLLENGRADEAFEICLSTYRNIGMLDTELSIGHDRQVNAESWLAAQVSATWAAASLDQRDQIAKQATALLAQTKAATETSLWQRFYSCFGSLDLAAPLGIELATMYIERGEAFEAQQLLLSLIESEDTAVHKAAIALSSRLLHEVDRPFLAATFDQVLRENLADEECLAGMTGLECLASWSTIEADRKDWPYGQVDVGVVASKVLPNANRNRRPQTGIFLQRSDSILGSCNVALHNIASERKLAITVHDSLGREFFRAHLDQGSRANMNVRGDIFGVSRGNLLILSFGHQLAAFDTTLSADGSTLSQPLWRKNTTSALHAINQLVYGQNTAARIGPITQNSCIFQIDQQLVCVDSRSGTLKWSRDKLPLHCDLYGDSDYVFAVPKASKQAMIFSAVDGRSLGNTNHRLPTSHERLATVGRQVIRWRRRADRRWELSAVDSWQGKTLWKHEFEKNSQADTAQNRFVTVAEPTGRCVIVDISNGELVVDQPIKANVSLKEIHLLVGTKNFLIAAQQPSKIDNMRRVSSINGTNGTDFTRSAFAGQIYLFDRDTGLAVWDRPAEVEGLPLMLTQAVNLPAVVFAGNIRRQSTQGTKNHTGIMLLEKSSGRILYHEESLPPSPRHFFPKVPEDNAAGNSNKMVIEMNTQQINLTFTDRPRAPEPPAMHGVQHTNDSGKGGLQKIGAGIFSF